MHRTFIVFAVVSALSAATPSSAQERRFPGPPTDTNPRANTPNDPDFDRAEPDDEDGDSVPGTSVFEEDHRLFGFPPFSTRDTAHYRDPLNPRFGQAQVSGVSADLAWKLSIGDQTVEVAVCDTGVDWGRSELRLRIRLNAGELPVPLAGGGLGAKGQPLFDYDRDGDGAFTPDDYAGIVPPDLGPNGSPAALDGQDVLVFFSDGADDDSNGFIDDISGWDFFDEDNDPFDSSSHGSARNHGSSRAEEAAQEGDNDASSIGVCPRCRFVPIRIWDSFVADNNNFALALVYAADNGIEVIAAAIGAFTTTEFAQAATQYAYEQGVALLEVSSDLNTANHNTPTNFNNTIFVKGVVADVEGLGAGGNEFFPPVPFAAADAPIATWFRDSNLTQYGGHAHINMKGSTGSQCTGQAAGAAALLMSYGVQRGMPLTSNEVKQVLTLTAEDVLPGDTLGTGVPDPAQAGWDQHFGYGRVDLRRALERLGVPALGIPASLPPEATIERPAWFQVLDPDRDNDGVNESLLVPIVGTASADRGPTASLTWTLEFGIGIEPLVFTTFASGSSPGRVGFDTSVSPPRRPGAPLGELDLTQVMAAFPPGTDFSAPPSGPVVQGQANVPSNQFVFTVRLRVRDGDDSGNFGEDRKVFFLHHDPTKHSGWPIAIDANGDGLTDGGGEPTPHIVDLDGDNAMEVVVATAAGRVHVFGEDGAARPGFPVSTRVARNAAPHLGSRAFAGGRLSPPAPAAASRPAIGDLDRDGFPEIVLANIEGDVYVFSGGGELRPGFPVRIDPALSAPSVRSEANHVKTGIFGSPVLGDLDRDGFLDIVVSALDQHAYAWNRNGSPLPGWPVKLQDPNPGGGQPPAGAESINTPVIADLDRDGAPEVVVATNEVYESTGDVGQFFPDFREVPTSVPGLNSGTVLSAVFAFVGGSGRVYAVHGDGNLHAGGPFVRGWPVRIDGLAADVLPMIGPGHNVAIGDLDLSPGLEVAASITTSNLVVFGADGRRLRDMDPVLRGPLSDAVLDPGGVLNLFEYPVIGDIDRSGTLDLTKAGVTLSGLLNLVLVGQNQPFHHVLQAWDASTGLPLAAYPRVIDDYGLLTVPFIANVGATLDAGDTLNLPEVVSGNGLYLVHAHDAAGREPAGWPKLTGGWQVGRPGAGDIDDDGLLELAWSTREGNFFVWDTPASMCNTRTTPNLDGRDGAYNPQVNNWNNNLYGQDTVPPARFRPGEIAAAHDPKAGTILVTFSRVPGDDLYCGTSGRFDFRFSTSEPITTQAAFDAATPVASVPPPPAGNRDAGGSLTLEDARFAGETVFLAVQVADDAGNLSPLTPLGSFAFAQSFRLEFGLISFGPAPGGGDDLLAFQALLPAPISSFDTRTEAMTLTLSDAGGTIYTAAIPPGSFLRLAGGNILLFQDPSGAAANGVTQVLVLRADGGMRVWVIAQRLDLTEADQPEITTTFRLGEESFQSTNRFRRIGNMLIFL